MAYRSSEHDTTKFSPCMLMLGREIELPVDLIYGPHPQSEEFPDETQAVFAYSDNMQKRMWKVQEKARSNILKASDRQKRQSQSTQIPNWRCCMATHSLKSKTEKSKATKKLGWSIFCNKGDI